MEQEGGAGPGSNGPLEGLRVLDLTSTMSGPFCTLLLAQLGALVDKIEPPVGDVLRRVPGGKSATMSPIFLAFNAGKRSISLNLGVESNRELLRRSFRSYDVIVHNMRPSAAGRIGLTQTALSEAGSDAVLCEIVGYGPGPFQDQPAYDDTIQAASGMAWVQGNGATPEYVRTAIADKTAGIYAALAVCAELSGRARGRAARAVKIPMLETLAAFTTIEQLGGLTFDPPTGPALYARTASPERRPYATADGYISVMIYTDRHWRAFLAEIGRMDLIIDPRFATLAGRTSNIDEVYEFVAEQVAERTTDEWVQTLRRIDVPHARVNSLGDLFEDLQLASVKMFAPRSHPTEGTLRTARPPFLFDDEPLADPGFAEQLGASTAAFIAEHCTVAAES
ncbi:CoA transferase [Diaminobutyricibacter tongyongensis]|uniref:CoA transferase n=1 Tax=Leifsonia tongyongensis TaxID=1268043 RepID=A0A6L9Y2M8_9MICO|nr:CoA transferase [Diaminobutyricibacter tongyongensis]NEN07667.1 CoA transferase [Diaminobutyricibacter tongyongensis]